MACHHECLAEISRRHAGSSARVRVRDHGPKGRAFLRRSEQVRDPGCLTYLMAEPFLAGRCRRVHETFTSDAGGYRLSAGGSEHPFTNGSVA